MEPIEPNEPTRLSSAFAGLAIFVTLFCVLLFLFFLFHEDSQPLPADVLRHNCESHNGVIIEGINERDEEVNHFVVCVPYEALTCIDVE